MTADQDEPSARHFTSWPGKEMDQERKIPSEGVTSAIYEDVVGHVNTPGDVEVRSPYWSKRMDRATDPMRLRLRVPDDISL